MQPFLNDISTAFPAIVFQQAETNTATEEADVSSSPHVVSGSFQMANKLHIPSFNNL
jgi:hypothetical protein